jgi:dipeptidyl aminopeptidase/acylaminoacyl peptidase
VRDRPTIVAALLLAAVVLVLAGCSPPAGRFRERLNSGEPTMTAILLPTRTATDIAGVDPGRNYPEPTETVQATRTPEPTATTPPKLSPTATPVAPTPTSVPTLQAESPTPEPVTRPATRPTAIPELAGRLVFQTTLGGDFYVIDVGGDEKGRPDLRPITDGIDPIWSPDGQQIAFTRWREPRGVWIVSTGSGMDDPAAGERRVFDWHEARWPSWSPGGEQLLFSRQYGGKEGTEICFRGRCFSIPAQPYWKLGIVNAGDGAFAEPPGPDIAQAPSWSPDGEWIVYAGNKGLVVQDLAGERFVQITDAARDTGPVWSPDGKQVAFTRSQHDHWEIYVNTFPGGPQAGGGRLTRLTTTPDRPDGQPGSSAAPAWSPDGQHLAFLTDRTGKWEIWVTAAPGNAPAGGSRPRPMFGAELDGLTLEYSYGGERALSWTQ